MARLSVSSSIRLNNFVPSALIVSGRSNGKRSYIFPPAKWQGWQRTSRIGWIWVAKSIVDDAVADGTEVVFWREFEVDGASSRCVRSHAEKLRATARTRKPSRMGRSLPEYSFSSKIRLRGDNVAFFEQTL
jgi:hypothetical protein